MQVAINKNINTEKKLELVKIFPHSYSIMYCQGQLCERYYYSKCISSCLDMNNPFVFYIISDAMHLAYSFVGYNYLFGETHSSFF